MPTDCEPCPGNTSASFIVQLQLSSPSQRATDAPGEAAADPCQHDVLAGADASVAHRVVERERNRRRRGIGVPVDRGHHLVDRQVQLLRGRLDDADVGLMRNQPVDRRRPAARLRSALPRVPRRSTFTANLNTALPSIVSSGCRAIAPSADRARARARMSRSCRRPRAAGWTGCPGLVDGASTTAPAPSPNSTQVPRSSSRGCAKRPRHRRPARCAPAAATMQVGDAERVDEAAAHGLHVEGRAAAACPSLACRMHAVDGNTMSGVVVATTIRSTSAGASPAAASARRAARAARDRSSARPAPRCAARGCRCASRSIRRWCRPCARELVVGQDLRRQVAAGADDRGTCG